MSIFDKNTEMDEIEAQIQKLNDQAAEQFLDAAWRRDVAQQLGAEIYEGFRNNNLVDIVTTVKRYPRNGTAEIRNVRGLKAFHIARGGYIEESTITEDTFYIDKNQIGFHLVEHQDRLETGFVRSAQQLVSLGKQRLDAEINRAVFSAMKAAVSDINADNYVATAGLTLSELSDAIAMVEDAPDAGYGGTPVIVARATMVRKIRDALTANFGFTAFTPETNEDLLRRGQIGSFMGTPIVQVANYRDEDGKAYFPANELWVIGKDAVQTAFFGEPRVKEFIEDDAEYWHYINRLDYGVAVVHASHMARIVDASIPANR